jgi:hypothetical protein
VIFCSYDRCKSPFVPPLKNITEYNIIRVAEKSRSSFTEVTQKFFSRFLTEEDELF